MPTIFTHAMLPVAVAAGTGTQHSHSRLLLLAMTCSILPDADVLAFSFGIPYSSPWGHRGFTHSLFFALAVALSCLPMSSVLKASRPMVFISVFLSTASHALLDACTNGGLGVALWWPLSDMRVFLPWRPVEVSPIGAHGFFTQRGLTVFGSELKWVWLPAVLASAGLWIICRLLRAARGPDERK